MPARYTNASLILYLGSEVERMGTALGSDRAVMEDAIGLCGDVIRSGYSYSSLDAVASAAFYLATRRQGAPISLPDVAEQSRKPKGEFQGLASRLMTELDIQLTPDQPDSYLDDGIEQLDFSEPAAEEARTLLERSKDAGLHNGLAPTTMAGAVLYAVAQKRRLDITQKTVADIVNKTQVSIRKQYRNVLELADDVPVDVLPPQTIAATVETLQETFDDIPEAYAAQAGDLVRELSELEESASRAGLTGAAYLVVCQREGAQLSKGQISDAVGVTVGTITTHTARFDQ